MASLVKTALPKSKSGRKPAELDSELVEALTDALKKNPTDTVDGEKRPAAYGPETTFDTEGKATSAGRRYANVVAETLKTTVRVNSYTPTGDTEKGPFQWRCYIPLSVSENNKKGGKK